MKHIAFTGTQRGMTDEQERTLPNVLCAVCSVGDWFHHGDCIGADAQAHQHAKMAALRTHVHPCNIPTKRAFCIGDAASPVAPPLDRNRVMVDLSYALIATPKSMVEELRSGTWATIRYARKRGVPVHIIWPDGQYVPPPPR